MLFLKVTIANQQKARKANRQNRFLVGFLLNFFFFGFTRLFDLFIRSNLPLNVLLYMCNAKEKNKNMSKNGKNYFPKLSVQI